MNGEPQMWDNLLYLYGIMMLKLRFNYINYTCTALEKPNLQVQFLSFP